MERPAIVRPAAEILAIHRLRLGVLTIVEQEGAKRVPYRHGPIWRFAVTQLVFLRDRRPQRLDPHLHLPFANEDLALEHVVAEDRKSTRLNSSHLGISYAVFCLKKTKPATT